uniref:Uncharacterized protein n=1 Tax=Lepeophtheirus salmonis TaxID=72036 RepID=A0A0K2TXD0_LEPSM
MDDVWLVIGLLLFGSLLFCLCCYKVTNLLYMLYHIDDTEIEDLEDCPMVGGGSGSGVTANAVASGDEIKDYRLLNNVASSTGLGCNHLYSTPTPPSMPQNLYTHTFFEPKKKSTSVSSLSVGIQCDVLSLSEINQDSSSFLKDSRKSLIGSTPSIYRRVEAYHTGRRSRFQSSTSSLNKSAILHQQQLLQHEGGAVDETDLNEQKGPSSYLIEECNFSEAGSIPCQRHNQPQQLLQNPPPIEQGHFFSAHLLQHSNRLPPLVGNPPYTADHRSVPCQYSSFDCIQPNSSSTSSCIPNNNNINNSNNTRTCCPTHNGPHYHPQRYRILTKKSNSINNLNNEPHFFRSQIDHQHHHPNISDSNNGGFIIIPPPVDFSANSKFSYSSRLHTKAREDEDEEDEEEEEEEEEEELLLQNECTDLSDDPAVNPYTNSPTSLC